MRSPNWCAKSAMFHVRRPVVGVHQLDVLVGLVRVRGRRDLPGRQRDAVALDLLPRRLRQRPTGHHRVALRRAILLASVSVGSKITALAPNLPWNAADDRLRIDLLVLHRVAHPRRLRVVRRQRVVGVVQHRRAHVAQVGGRHVVAVGAQRHLLHDVDVEAVARFHDRDPHLVDRRLLAGLRLVDLDLRLARRRRRRPSSSASSVRNADLEDPQRLALGHVVEVERRRDAVRRQQRADDAARPRHVVVRQRRKPSNTDPAACASCGGANGCRPRRRWTPSSS
jgi:hypothetical protein